MQRNLANNDYSDLVEFAKDVDTVFFNGLALCDPQSAHAADARHMQGESCSLAEGKKR